QYQEFQGMGPELAEVEGSRLVGAAHAPDGVCGDAKLNANLPIRLAGRVGRDDRRPVDIVTVPGTADLVFSKLGYKGRHLLVRKIFAVSGRPLGGHILL